MPMRVTISPAVTTPPFAVVKAVCTAVIADGRAVAEELKAVLALEIVAPRLPMRLTISLVEKLSPALVKALCAALIADDRYGAEELKAVLALEIVSPRFWIPDVIKG